MKLLKQKCPLTATFFGLNSDYRKIVLDEIYYLVKHTNFTRVDALRMPVFERRFYLNKYIEEIEKQSEAMNNRKKT